MKYFVVSFCCLSNLRTVESTDIAGNTSTARIKQCLVQNNVLPLDGNYLCNEFLGIRFFPEQFPRNQQSLPNDYRAAVGLRITCSFIFFDRL